MHGSRLVFGLHVKTGSWQVSPSYKLEIFLDGKEGELRHKKDKVEGIVLGAE